MSRNAYARRKHDAARAMYGDGRTANDRDVRTHAGRGLLYSEDYPPGANRFRRMHDAILAIEDEAAATERRLTVERVRAEAERRFGLDPFFQDFLDDLATADVDEERS